MSPIKRPPEIKTPMAELKLALKERLVAETTAPGSRISPEILAYFFSCPYLRIWRLLHSPLFLPKDSEIGPIEKFLEILTDAREGACGLLELWAEGWNAGPLQKLPDITLQAILHPKLYGILRSRTLSREEKHQSLTLESLRILKTRWEQENKK